MNIVGYARFIINAIKINIRRVPLAISALIIAGATDFTLLAWVFRMIDADGGKIDSLFISIIAGIVAVYSIYAIFMYSYYVKASGENELPFIRMGSPAVLLLIVRALELIAFTIVASALGALFDTVMNYIAPTYGAQRYLDADLFFDMLWILLAINAAIFIIVMIINICLKRRKRA